MRRLVRVAYRPLRCAFAHLAALLRFPGFGQGDLSMGNSFDSLLHTLGWFALSVGSALFQVLRNMVMKRLGHALDETINVWGRFTFILPFAGAPLLVQGLPLRHPGVYWYCFLFAVTQIAGTQCLALALKGAEISLCTALRKRAVGAVEALGRAAGGVGVLRPR